MIPQKNPLIASGESVHANMLVKLWENPDPTASFGPQDISLSSSDYDFLLTIARRLSPHPQDISTITQKGDNVVLNVGVAGGSGATSAWRRLDYVNDTKLSAIDAKTATGTTAATTDNTQLVPAVIYGFKKSLDITAIVSNVSTDARLCMLSDGVTDVETKFGQVVSKVTKSITTSAAGNANLNINLSEYDVLSAYASNATNALVIPYRATATTWGVHCYNDQNSYLANTALDLVIYLTKAQ